jgi:serine/threonine-protein kinase
MQVGSAMPAEARDSTVPPLGIAELRVCPRCRAAAPADASWSASCPEHGLVYVDARALAESGHDPLLGVTLAGRFTVLSRIGSGSMGAVYRARQAAVGRDVALKIVRRDRAYDPETKTRFEREARAVSMLKSPHTVTAFDFGEAEDGSWFLALEMLEGETLGERLRREGRIEWREALRFAREALKSLAEAHAQGIIHRDLKPDNLFLARVHDPAGELEVCKILDFGIAKWVREEEAPVDQLQTLAGTVFGTPRYMSPEQAQGTQLDARSDLYSLGVLLFQMLTGRAPFVDDDAVVVMAKHIKNPPPTFAEAAPGCTVPESVEAVVRRALEKQAEHRPASAEQMLSELEQAATSTHAVESGVRPHIPAKEDDLPESLRLAKRRTWVLAALLAAALSALVGLTLGIGRRTALVPSSATESTVLPITPTVAPSSGSALPLENSASSSENLGVAAGLDEPHLVPATLASTSTGQVHPQPPPAKKTSTRAKPAPALERKGNERYGRFE